MISSLLCFVVPGSVGAFYAMRITQNQPPVFSRSERLAAGVFSAVWIVAFGVLATLIGNALER